MKGNKIHQFSCSQPTEQWPKDTKTSVCDFQVPQVDPQVVCRQVSFIVTIDGDGIDVIRVGIGKYPPWAGLHHQVHRPEHWHLQREKRAKVRPKPTTETALLSTALQHSFNWIKYFKIYYLNIQVLNIKIYNIKYYKYYIKNI